MSNYLRQVVFKTQFDGDEVTLVMNPLPMADALRLRSTPQTQEAVVTAFADILGRQLVSVAGLRAADGTDIPKEELLRDAYFTSLVTDAGSELFRHAMPQNPKQPAP